MFDLIPTEKLKRLGLQEYQYFGSNVSLTSLPIATGQNVIQIPNNEIVLIGNGQNVYVDEISVSVWSNDPRIYDLNFDAQLQFYLDPDFGQQELIPFIFNRNQQVKKISKLYPAFQLVLRKIEFKNNGASTFPTDLFFAYYVRYVALPEMI